MGCKLLLKMSSELSDRALEKSQAVLTWTFAHSQILLVSSSSPLVHTTTIFLRKNQVVLKGHQHCNL